MTSYFILPDWFDISVFVSDLFRISLPVVSLAVLVACGWLIIRILKKAF